MQVTWAHLCKLPSSSIAAGPSLHPLPPLKQALLSSLPPSKLSSFLFLPRSKLPSSKLLPLHPIGASIFPLTLSAPLPCRDTLSGEASLASTSSSAPAPATKPGHSSVSVASSASPSSATLVPAAAAAAAANERSSSSECEAEDSSSPLSKMESLDFTEAPWDESESFFLHKYPSYDIDFFGGSIDRRKA